LFIYLTPLVPLSFKGEGEDGERGALAPLRHPVKSWDLLQRRRLESPSIE